VLEPGVLGIAGGIAGAFVGLAASWIASYFGHWPLVIAGDAAINGAALSLFLGLIIGIVPAARAARLKLTEALRSS
jgi:putative ABC transport system permease protein